MADDRQAPQSDFAAVGGAPAIASVVDLFYQRVLADPQLVGYFAATDLITSLHAHDVRKDIIDRVVEALATTRDDVVAH